MRDAITAETIQMLTVTDILKTGGNVLSMTWTKMNDINKMWSICHDCPYWEVCDPPYNCVATEQKIKALFDNENKGN